MCRPLEANVSCEIDGGLIPLLKERVNAVVCAGDMSCQCLV